MRKNPSLKIIFVIILLIFIISGCVKAKCGDGVCQKSEKKQASCPADCPEAQTEIPTPVNKPTIKPVTEPVAPSASTQIKNIKILQEHAAHPSWSPDGKKVVFDKLNLKDYFYDIQIMDENGKILKTLTESSKINQRNNGWPAWHPSGNYIVFQSEEPKHYAMEDRWLTFPGTGFFVNLWATTPEGDKFWKLTDLDIKQTLLDGKVAQAIISPEFSHDGKKLMWTERYKDGGSMEWGYWQIKMADFITSGGGVRLANEKIVLRAEDICNNCNYVVNMGLFKDGNRILVAGNLDGQHVYGMDNYIYDMATKKLVNLQNTPEYWEEGACLANNETRIIYPTNINSQYKLDFNNKDWRHQPRLREYWVMNVDGSDKQKITSFNSPDSAEYSEIGQGRRMVVAECSFSPDDKKMMGIVGKDQRTDDQANIQVNIGLFEFK